MSGKPYRAVIKHRRKQHETDEKKPLEIPEEFIALCKEDDTDPVTVLRGFIGDLCGIINWVSSPRADGYGSHGSDERMMARDYYERVGYPFWKAWGLIQKD